jgi:hypothetical protein
MVRSCFGDELDLLSLCHLVLLSMPHNIHGRRCASQQGKPP